MKAFICDFEDSFTYNIYSELLELKFISEVTIINKDCVLKFLIDLTNTHNKEKTIIILGPGPGHPKQFSELLTPIQAIINSPSLYLMGICLGHQLISMALGLEVIKSEYPLHGKSANYNLPDVMAKELNLPPSISVQRYNSLSVAFTKDKSCYFKHYLERNDELVMASGARFISYQFHPESVGTTCPSSFFKNLEMFLL